MIQSLSLEQALLCISELPQANFIPKTRVMSWLESLSRQNDIKGLGFHVDRLKGVGGSESGAIMAHFHNSASSVKLEDGFKSADKISHEKLLLANPIKTYYGERGNRIEPVIRDAFCRKFGLTEKRDTQAMLACRTHSNNRYMLGNTDDIFMTNKGRTIVDYKSVVKSNAKLAVPFSNICQVNHYNEIGDSNGMGCDMGLTVNLVSEESVFQDIIAAYENRDSNPSIYEFWINAIVNDGLSCCRLEIKNINLDKQFGALINNTISQFMELYPLQGKTITFCPEPTVLNKQELIRATALEAKMMTLINAESETSNLIAEFSDELLKFQNEIGGKFEWPSRFPINISTSPVLNEEAAIEALEMSGANTERLYIPSDNLNEEKVIEKFKELNIELDDSFFKRKLDYSRVVEELASVGLSEMDFQMSKKVSAKLSRKNASYDQLQSSRIEIRSILEDTVNSIANVEVQQLEDLSISSLNPQLDNTFSNF